MSCSITFTPQRSHAVHLMRGAKGSAGKTATPWAKKAPVTGVCLGRRGLAVGRTPPQLSDAGAASMNNAKGLAILAEDLITCWPDRAMQPDWFVTRALTVAASDILPSPDRAGRSLSDHDLIICRSPGIPECYACGT